MFGATSVRILAGSATFVGLVWASRALWRRTRDPPPGAVSLLDIQPPPARSREQLLDEAAMADALRDLRDMRETRARHARRAEELERSPGRDPDDIDDDDIDEMDLDLGPNEGYLDPARSPEPSDAVDSENLGASWLLRATQASAPSRRDASDLPEGTHVIEPDAGEGDGEAEVPPPSTRPPDTARG